MIPRPTVQQMTKVITTLSFTIFGIYLGIQLQDHIDRCIVQRGIKSLNGTRVGESRFNWVSILNKHHAKIPYILGVVGSITGSSIVLNNDKVYRYLLTGLPGSLYSPAKSTIKPRLFGQPRKLLFGAIERQNTVAHMREVVAVMEAVDQATALTTDDRLEFYKTIITDVLTFEKLTPQVMFTITGFVSVLAYLFGNGHLLMFSQVVTALLELIKSGQISKFLARIIRNMLRIKGVKLPEELEDMEL